jgi:hypothetical protein
VTTFTTVQIMNTFRQKMGDFFTDSSGHPDRMGCRKNIQETVVTCDDIHTFGTNETASTAKCALLYFISILFQLILKNYDFMLYLSM